MTGISVETLGTANSPGAIQYRLVDGGTTAMSLSAVSYEYKRFRHSSNIGQFINEIISTLSLNSCKCTEFLITYYSGSIMFILN